MNHRFALPIAVAVAVHATLLFGFRHSPVTTRVGPAKPPVRETIFVLPPDRPEPVAEPLEAMAKGSPEVSRAEIEDRVRPATMRDFTLDVAPARPSLVPGDFKIDARLYGHPGGDENSRRIDGGPIVSVGLLDDAPAARGRIPPEYPDAAKRGSLEGEVLVEFVVDEAGRVIDPVVVRSSDAVFEAATLRAVAKWHFAPGKRDGCVVRFRMSVPLVFRLGEN